MLIIEIIRYSKSPSQSLYTVDDVYSFLGYQESSKKNKVLTGLIGSYASSDSENEAESATNATQLDKVDFSQQKFVRSSEPFTGSEEATQLKSKDDVDIKVEDFLAVST